MRALRWFFGCILIVTGIGVLCLGALGGVCAFSASKGSLDWLPVLAIPLAAGLGFILGGLKLLFGRRKSAEKDTEEPASSPFAEIAPPEDQSETSVTFKKDDNQ